LYYVIYVKHDTTVKRSFEDSTIHVSLYLFLMCESIHKSMCTSKKCFHSKLVIFPGKCIVYLYISTVVV